MSLLAHGLIYGSLLILLALISATETAIHSLKDVSDVDASEMASRSARRFRSIISNPFEHLHRALLISATLNLALAALGLHLVTGPLKILGWNPWICGMGLFLATVLLGDVIPKLMAARSPRAVLESSLLWLAPFRAVLDPITKLADFTADSILRKLVPSDLKMRMPITRDEFDTLVEMREEQGQLDADEASMIREVLDIEDFDVRDCMIPRTDLPLMSVEETDADAHAILNRPAGRYVVVHGETPDVVEGVIDTSIWRLSGRPDWKSFMKPPIFVPETMPVLDALENHLVGPDTPILIVDEYGGLEGLITQAQIADWVLHDAAPWLGEESEMIDLGEGRYLLDGGTRLEDVAEKLALALEAEGVDTIGGYVFTFLGHVPKAGERLTLENGAELKVRRVVKARIQQIEIRLLSPTREEVPV